MGRPWIGAWADRTRKPGKWRSSKSFESFPHRSSAPHSLSQEAIRQRKETLSAQTYGGNIAVIGPSVCLTLAFLSPNQTILGQIEPIEE